MLLALVLATGAIMWARGTLVPCINKGNPYGSGKAVTRPVPMYTNPSYVGGADRAARGRTDSVV